MIYWCAAVGVTVGVTVGVREENGWVCWSRGVAVFGFGV